MGRIPVYASTGAFVTRSNGRNYRLIPEVLSKLHADGAEFMMYDSWNDEVETVREFLKASGVPFPAMHVDKSIGERMAEGTEESLKTAQEKLWRDVRTADRIGAEKLVLHLWSGPNSDIHFGAMLDGFEKLSSIAREAGRLLTVENVTCRITKTLPRLKALRDRYPDVRFTYDTKMAQLHGENELLMRPEWDWLFAEKRVSHLHVNDTSLAMAGSGRMPVLHFGDGEVDFSSLFTYIRSKCFDGTATVESTSSREDGSVDTDKLNFSLDAVRKALNPDG